MVRGASFRKRDLGPVNPYENNELPVGPLKQSHASFGSWVREVRD